MMTMNENLRKAIIATGGLLIGIGSTLWFLDRAEGHHHQWTAWQDASTNTAYWSALKGGFAAQLQSKRCTNCNIITFEVHQ